MRKTTITFIATVLAILVSSLIASAQTAKPKPQWLKCPQCQTPEERAASRAKEEKLPFNPKDLTGIWNQNRIQLNREAPPMTDWGKARYEETKTEATINGETVSNTKDPMPICDPLGWPRWFTYNYGFEFLQLPDRMVQFLEWGHTYRTIWTDGRDLPSLDEVDPHGSDIPLAVGREIRSSSSPPASMTDRGCRRTEWIGDMVIPTAMKRRRWSVIIASVTTPSTFR